MSYSCMYPGLGIAIAVGGIEARPVRRQPILDDAYGESVRRRREAGTPSGVSAIPIASKPDAS